MIPAELYRPIFYNLLLVLTLITAYQLYFNLSAVRVYRVKVENENWTWLLAILLSVFIGFRPISGVFVDTTTYAGIFSTYQNSDLSEILLVNDDYLFSMFMFYSSKIMSVNIFFFVISVIYIFCPLWALRRIFPNNVWLAFLMFISAFSFFAYGTNGLRNGMATSVFLLALSYFNKKWLAIVLMIVSVGIHKSMILPTFAFLCILFYRNTKFYIFIWLLTIPVSLVSGGYWENLFGDLGFDDRLSYITTEADAASFSSTGFRWDFLLYSSIPILVGYYVVFKRKYNSEIYSYLLNVYIISNAFWILVIRANFSNRFAYLSWFLYPIVLLYPFLKFPLWKKQYSKVAFILVLHFTFTYMMWLIK
jgi:hypothetical protein